MTPDDDNFSEPLPTAALGPDGEAPLSFAQRRIWFLEEFGDGDPVFNLRTALRLRGPLDVDLLQKAIDGVVARHQTLRTTFRNADGTPVQVINGARSLDLPCTDLSRLASADAESELRRRFLQRAREIFDLSQDLLIRGELFRLAAHDHVLLLVMHHLAADGWSLNILLRELAHLYSAGGDQQPEALPVLDVHYADFAVWQRRQWDSDALLSEARYWKQQLEGAPPFLELPTDLRRPASRSSVGARLEARVPEALTQGLRELSRANGCTVFMAFLATYATLLHRYSGQDDIVIGSPIAGRGEVELEGIIGFFVNTLPLRVDLSGDPTWLELLRRVRKATLAAYTHQELPFERLVEELRPTRTLSHTPVFQAMLAFQNTPRSTIDFGGLDAEPADFDCGTSNFDLTCFVQDDPDAFGLTFEYSTELFEADTIARMAGQLEVLLAAIVDNSAARVSELPLLTWQQRSHLVDELSGTVDEGSIGELVHRRFEAQVDAAPAAVAVVFEDEQVGYRDLDERANRLARQLVARGAGPATVAGVLLERSIDMVVAVLGVLKSGGAYLPLDPSFPESRRAFMLADAGASVLVTQESLRPAATEFDGPTISLDGDRETIGAHSPDRLRQPTTPDDLIYVIYTSGSTGEPKGVQIRHGAVANLFTSLGETPGVAAEDRWLAVTTLSFDISVPELLLPLTVGGRVVVASRDTVADGRRLVDEIAGSGATIMQATPATWQMLLAAGWDGSPGLEVLCGGEALSAELAVQLVDRAASVWNMYGPTETTVWSSLWRVPGSFDRVSIGRPLRNTRIYLLDGRMDPVPPGVAGEIYIGGAGVARGYLRRPGLTAERFVPDPFVTEDRQRSDPDPAAAEDRQRLDPDPAAAEDRQRFDPDPAAAEDRPRLYRTGDLGRRDAGGNLVFLRRADDQTKVRGFRVELGEIECALAEHEAVQQAVATVQEFSPIDRRLVAFYVPAPDVAASVTTLRRHLRKRIPDHAIPQHIVELDSLPLRASGKVDRSALPAALGRESSVIEHVEPRTGNEKLVADIWREALGVDRVSVHDNFFDLGGHSLLSAQVVARIERATGAKLSLRTIMLDTLGQLAASLAPR